MNMKYTPEEEFVARLTYHCLSAYDLLTRDECDFIRFRSYSLAAYNPSHPCYYYSTKDLYVTDLKILLPKEQDFRFVVHGNSIAIELRP